MRSSFISSNWIAAIAVLFVAGQVLQAEGQAAGKPAKSSTDRTRASDSLPSDFIDSRPIVAYFDDQIMPNTVRGLLEALKQPDRCGAGAKLSPSDACALVLYKLDDEFTPDRTRPPFIIKAIYRVSDARDLADTVITVPDPKGVLQRYAGGDLYEPLRNVRANICLQTPGVEQCRATASKGVLYVPYAILGKIENDRESILPEKSAHKHFTVLVETQQFADKLKEDQLLAICRLKKTCQ